jgi:thiamine-phosphate pyrophosphorylase
MKQSHHNEKPLSKKERRQKRDALKMAEQLLLQYTDLQVVCYDMEYLHQCLEAISQLKWWQRPSKFVQSLSIGYALGECMCQNMGFEWLVYQDYLGKNIALKHYRASLICFPIATAAQRIKEKNYQFIPPYYHQIKTQISMPNLLLPRLHYVSQGNSVEQHLEGINKALKAGCKWVQLRLKEVNQSVYIAAGLQCRTWCSNHQALLTINDDPEVALAVSADGLHLGKNDCSPGVARQIVGPEMIIGATVNDWQDVLNLQGQPIQYLGMGPLRFTQTKKKLSPVLGLSTYRQLLQSMKAHAIDLPVLAIGGIGLDDIEALKKTGVYGVAVSGLLYKAKNTTDCVQKIKHFWV